MRLSHVCWSACTACAIPPEIFVKLSTGKGLTYLRITRLHRPNLFSNAVSGSISQKQDDPNSADKHHRNDCVPTPRLVLTVSLASKCAALCRPWWLFLRKLLPALPPPSVIASIPRPPSHSAHHFTVPNLPSTWSLEHISSQNVFPKLLTFASINIDQNEPLDAKIKIILGWPSHFNTVK